MYKASDFSAFVASFGWSHKLSVSGRSH